METIKMLKSCHDFMEEYECRAMSVSVYQGGAEVFSVQDGTRDGNSKHKIDKKTMFSIGSISKMFAVVSIMMLVEQGKLTLDTPVYKILPQFKMKDKNYQKITVKMLLNHSSALMSTAKMGKYTNEVNRNFLRETIDFYSDSYLNGVPSKVSAYCNDGYSLVELIVEQISKTGYANFVYKNICLPCGLDDTDFQVHELREQRIVLAKSEMDRNYPQEFVNGIASGGIVSTAEDVCAFMNTFLTGQLISKTSIEEMGKLRAANPYGVDLMSVSHYGLGWDEVDMRPFDALNQRVWAKSGSTYGFSSYAMVLPDADAVVTVLLCTDKANAAVLAKKLAAVMLDSPIKPLPLSPIDSLEPSEQLEGLYANNNQIFKVTVSSKLFVESWENGKYVKASEAKDCPYKNLKFAFVKSGKKTLMLAEYEDPAFEGVWQRVILAQKLRTSYTSNNWNLLQDEKYICASENLNCRKFGIAPIFLTIRQEKGYADTLLFPHPLRILNDKYAVPFIEIPGDYGKEMDSLEMIDSNALQLGQRLYVNVKTARPLVSKEIKFRSTEIDWYYGANEIDTLRFDGRVRCFIVDKNGELLFDSDLCSSLPESVRDCYIGFLAEEGAKATITVMEE